MHGAGWLRGGAQHRRRRSRAVDAAPLEAGLIDEVTFVAQGITGTWQTVDALRFIVEDLGVQPDLLLLGTSFPDAASRQFLGFLAASDADGAIATPIEGGDGEGVAIDADEVEASFATATSWRTKSSRLGAICSVLRRPRSWFHQGTRAILACRQRRQGVG